MTSRDRGAPALSTHGWTPRTIGGLAVDRWVLAALSIAILLRLFNLDAAALWLDETETAIWAALRPHEVSATVLERVTFGDYDPRHLPFYFVVLNAWTKLAGISPWSLRLPSVVFSVIAIALSAAVAHALAGARAARWAAVLAAISPFLIHHAQEARMYALINMLAAGSVLLMSRYFIGRTPRLGVAFALVNVALLLTHYYTVFLVAAELALLASCRRGSMREWFPAAAISAAAMFVVCYVALFLTEQSSGEVYGAGMIALPGSIWAMVAGYAFLPSAQEMHAYGMQAVLPYLPYALVAALPVMVTLSAGYMGLDGDARILVALLLAGVFLGPFAASALFPRISLNPRYFMAGAPLLFAVLAMGIPRLDAPRWRKVCAAGVIGLMTWGTLHALAHPGEKREDIIGAGRWLEHHVALDEPVFVTSGEMASIARYHWPERDIRLYPDRGVRTTQADAPGLTSAIPFPPDADRVIYLFGRSWVSDPQGALEQEVARSYRSCGTARLRGIRIYCLLR